MDFQGSGRKVLVTGGAGFIGSNLAAELLELGYVVKVVDSLVTGRKINIEPLMDHPNFEFVQADLCEYEVCEQAVAGVEIIFHQAAIGSVPRSINAPLNTNASNVTGFLNVLEAARQAGVKRFVYAASSSTYGDHKALPKVEDVIGKPLSPYAVSKYINELYADVFGKTYGMETIGLRYFNVFGRQQDPDGAYAAVIPKFVKSLINHESPTINGDGSQSRDFTYIDNVIQANLRAGNVQDPAALNQVYNVAYGESASLLELVEILKELLTPYDAEIAKVAVNHGPDRLGDIKHSLASIDKGRSLLGYDPKFDLRKGLTAAISWYWHDLAVV